MFKKIVIAAAVAQFLVVSAFAQTTKAEVKAEAASANKAGAIAKGEDTKAPKAKSEKPRAEVKAEAKAAEKAGLPKGEEGAAPKAKSEKARAEVKKEAKDAAKAQPKGEAPK